MAFLQTLTTSIHRSYTSSTSPSTINRSFTSWLLPPSLLAVLRLLISLYCFLVLFYAIGWQSGLGETAKVQQSFSYFTVLGYWGLAFYFAFAAAQTASAAWKGDGKAWLAGWSRGLRGAFAVFAGSVTVFPFVVTGEFLSGDLDWRVGAVLMFLCVQLFSGPYFPPMLLRPGLALLRIFPSMR